MKISKTKLKVELTKEEKDKVLAFYDFYIDLCNLVTKETSIYLDEEDMGHFVLCVLEEDEDSEIEFVTK